MSGPARDGVAAAGGGEPPVLRFDALSPYPVGAALSLRQPGVALDTDKEVVLADLQPSIDRLAGMLGGGRGLVTAEQTHGNGVAVVGEMPDGPVPVVDALVTTRRDLLLGIAVADCCPVWFWTADGRGVGLAHAGRKGAEAGVAAATARELARHAGCAPGDIGAFLGPCIRVPDYEVDIPAMIAAQLRALGLEVILDCGLNTAADTARFYSYRKERGRTGRMMAFAWLP